MNPIKSYMELSKFRISIFATISTAVGYLLSTGRFSIGILIPVMGIFLLACSSCALNQIQDREIDPKMNRTKNRPLPSGRITVRNASIFVIITLLAGSLILYVGANLLTMVLGLSALVWYNGIYTYLKRVTSLAVIPGAVVGAIPPLLGWAAGGRSILDPAILSVAFLFFIWQVPHFWLLLLNYNEDYDRGGLPSISHIFSTLQIKRMTFVWIVATAVTGIIIPLYLQMLSPMTNVLFVIFSFWLIGASLHLIEKNRINLSFMKVFRDINIYILVVVMILTVGKLMQVDTPALRFLVER